MILKSF
jgi:hypothetical protein